MKEDIAVLTTLNQLLDSALETRVRAACGARPGATATPIRKSIEEEEKDVMYYNHTVAEQIYQD